MPPNVYGFSHFCDGSGSDSSAPENGLQNSDGSFSSVPVSWLRLFHALRCRRRSQVRRSLFHNIPAGFFIYDFSSVRPRRCEQSVSALSIGQRKRAISIQRLLHERFQRRNRPRAQDGLRSSSAPSREKKSGPANARTNSQTRDIPLFKPKQLRPERANNAKCSNESNA